MRFREVFESEVYTIENALRTHYDAEMQYTFRMVAVEQLTKLEWQMIYLLQGRLSTSYLRFFYGGARTQLLLISLEERLVALLWLVPHAQIWRRYPFVEKEAAAIIACVTDPEFRGRGIYPMGIRRIASSNHSVRYFIWAHRTNAASLRGIVKAGGARIGYFVRVRWLRGLFSQVRFHALDSDAE